MQQRDSFLERKTGKDHMFKKLCNGLESSSKIIKRKNQREEIQHMSVISKRNNKGTTSSPPREKRGTSGGTKNFKKSKSATSSPELKEFPLRENKFPHSSLPIISLGKTAERILTETAKGSNPYAIARKLNCTRENVKNHLKRLEQKNFVKLDFHIWKITDEGNRYLGGNFYSAMSEREGGTLELSDRAHNIKIKYPVISMPKENSWLSGWKARPMKNNTFYYNNFGNIQLQFTGKSMIVQLPILRFPSAELANMEAGRIANALMKQYERDFELKLGHPDWHSQIISQHHAIQHDPYAEFCRKHGISYDEDGIDVDSSQKGIPEVEFTDKKTAHIQADNYMNFIKDTSKTYDNCFPLSESSSILKGVILGLSKVQENQENINSNFERLQKENIETASGLNAITSFVKSQLPKQQENISQIKSSSDTIPSYFG
jgi:DNA-binding CsgD family transcriptional regulator